jgi:hypothetical protein
MLRSATRFSMVVAYLQQQQRHSTQDFTSLILSEVHVDAAISHKVLDGGSIPAAAFVNQKGAIRHGKAR